MKRGLNCYVVMASATIWLAAGSAGAQTAGLGTLPGSELASAWGINENGDMAARTRGMATLRGQRRRAQSPQALTTQTGDERSASFKFVSIDIRNATFTIANGISPGGDIVGVYGDASFNKHGFLLRHGKFTTIDVPGALVGVSGTLQTEANGINDQNEAGGQDSSTDTDNTDQGDENAGRAIVGDYFAPPAAPGAPECKVALSPACQRGFLYSKGRFSDVLVPRKKGSIPNSITPDGTIYGCDHDDDYLGSMFGFARTRFGTYITLNAGGGELANPGESVPDSMNNGATPDGRMIVGFYIVPPVENGTAHGFVVHRGRFSTYDVPGSTLTGIWGTNPAGDFVGLYDDASGNEHGFLQRWGESAPVTIDVPSGPPFNATLTDAFGINPEGHIVGLYLDSSGNTHGFLAVPISDNEAKE